MKFFLKPKPGLRVIDDQTMNPLPPEGKLVAKSTYWLRRLKFGEVELAEPPKKSAPAPKRKAGEE